MRAFTTLSPLLLPFVCAILAASFPEMAHAMQGLIKITYKYERHFPESFDWDKTHKRFLVGSTTRGSLVALKIIDEFVDVQEFVEDPDYAGTAAILGVSVDLARNRVVVAVHGLNHSFDAVAAYDLVSKTRVLFARLDGVGEGRSLINDVTVDSEGNVFATNSLGNFIWKIDMKGEAAVFARSPLFSSLPVIVSEELAPYGLNGIAYHHEGFLLVVQTNSGSLFRVDSTNGDVHLVLKESLKGVDGMTFRKGGSLVAISADKMWLMTSTDMWMTATIEEELPLNASSDPKAVVDKDGSHCFILHSYMKEAGEGSDRDLFEIEEKQFIKDTEDDVIWLILIVVLFVVIVCAWRFQMAHFYKQYRKKLV